MAIALMDLRRGDADRYGWLPSFDGNAEYDTLPWDDDMWRQDDPWFVQVLDNGVEIARIEFVDPGNSIAGYPNAPVLGPERLLVHRFEVAVSARGHGVATRTLRALAQRHPDRRLFAYSAEADGFWGSLGWERFDRPDPIQWPVFIQPA